MHILAVKSKLKKTACFRIKTAGCKRHSTLIFRSLCA